MKENYIFTLHKVYNIVVKRIIHFLSEVTNINHITLHCTIYVKTKFIYKIGCNLKHQ